MQLISLVRCESPTAKVAGWRALFLIFCAAISAGCAEIPIPPEVSYPNVRIAARNAAFVLADQIKRTGDGDGAIWVSPAINLHSGEITASGRELEVLLSLDLKTLLGNSVVQNLDTKETPSWNWVLAPTVQFEKPQDGKLEESWFKISVAAVSPRGKSLPGVTFRVNAHQFDATPSRFFRDAPLVLTGTFHDTRQEFYKGSKSNVALDIRNRFISTEGFLQEAVSSYEAGDFRRAIKSFDKIIEKDTDNLTALSGKYQSFFELGSTTEAESALGQLMSAAIKQGNISFKFLFQVRSIEFRDDIDITQRYQSWLKQIARQINASGMCMNVLGHASRSGSLEYNQQLSESRAGSVMSQLLKHVPELKGRIKAEGRSYRDNIVGSGTDDATDAIDRRVAFQLHSCR